MQATTHHSQHCLTHREQEEQLFELAFMEVVNQKLLGIGAQAGDVVVLAHVLAPQICNAFLHILSDLHHARLKSAMQVSSRADSMLSSPCGLEHHLQSVYILCMFFAAGLLVNFRLT